MKHIKRESSLKLLHKGLLLCSLIIEYGFVFLGAGQICGTGKNVPLFWGYFFLLLLLLFNSHNKSVRLRYEDGISLLLKDVLVNGVFGIFCMAVQEEGTSGSLWIKIICLTALNMVSIVIISFIIKQCGRKREKSGILFICEDAGHLPRSELVNHERQKIMAAGADIKELEAAIKSYEVVYLWDVSAERRNDLLKLCYENDRTVYTTAKTSDVLLRASGITQDFDTPVYFLKQFGIGTGSRVLKRGFDIIFSLVFLIVLLPVFLIVAACIKIEDGGSVFYRQVRCTKDMKKFEIYKFRSMVTDAEKSSGACLAKENDERLTRVGRFIRNTKLDELPQLVNILKGDMSVVGPRPERPELIEKAVQEVPEFILRTKVSAGLTGYAQVRGNYNTDFLDKLKWDLMYIENYSFLLDLKIMLMTVFVIFQKNNQEDFSKWEI